ncbi:hypothetical protein EGH24_00025 [Halonotius terrestris]|uniref:Uncharacterized protein n=1 Tax=Halonotius terrestris TaxID=2487750 RepID=A0A8J8TDE7_9EURY|nr:hypothetical protein [Halonotius terrestris]TQQ83232.1 hypothetical protein EGH24_00025 [Halonotius terrestris]
MRRLRALLPLGIAAAMLAIVVILYRFPTQVLAAVPSVRTLLSAAEPVAFLLAATVMLVFVGLVIIVRSRLLGDRTLGDDEPRTEATQSLFRDGSTTRGDLGAGFDANYETATDYGGTSRNQREAARRATVAELGRTAATTIQRTTSDDADSASEAVGTGDWTTDDRAAGLLADEEGPSVPLALTVWDLLRGRDPFETGVAHAITAIERYYNPDGTDQSARDAADRAGSAEGSDG